MQTNHTRMLCFLIPLWRMTAWLAVGVVLALSILGASPTAHEHLHCDAGQVEHVCAITLFAQGVTPALAVVMLAFVVWRLLHRRFYWREVFVRAPAFVHLPGRAPPAA